MSSINHESDSQRLLNRTYAILKIGRSLRGRTPKKHRCSCDTGNQQFPMLQKSIVRKSYLKNSRCSPPKCRSDFWLGRIRHSIGNRMNVLIISGFSKVGIINLPKLQTRVAPSVMFKTPHILCLLPHPRADRRDRDERSRSPRCFRASPDKRRAPVSS